MTTLKADGTLLVPILGQTGRILAHSCLVLSPGDPGYDDNLQWAHPPVDDRHRVQLEEMIADYRTADRPTRC